MKLVVSGLFLDLPSAGSGQYTVRLLRELSLLWDEDIVVLTPDSTRGRDRTASEKLLSVFDPASNLRIYPVHFRLRGDLGKLWFEQVGVPLAARKAHADILHVPYFAPPVFSPCPVVVTVHDLITMAWPDARPSIPLKLYNALAAIGAKRASQVIADSEHTKRDIMRILAVPSDRLSVVYLGAPAISSTYWSESGLVNLLAKYGLKKQEYILYIGGLDRRKNVTTLLRAFASLDTSLPLALAGEPRSASRENFPDLLKEVDELGLRDRVKFLGWVGEEDKSFLYAAANFFVYPSVYEGFGLPPLEAMACGTPVICSNATSLPEVVGESALTFDPTDVATLAKLMDSLSKDVALREDLRRKGLAQVARFSWRKTAEETLSVYRKALNSGRKLKERVTT